ncbi:MAG: peptide chain release factor N(5)-glutamine methyltransferase [Flavobacteriaceae bacterium]|nr:peptide chain release factor N(5)-glutamine methyltransferase [Flavobacteriaceae bacterium]
MTLKELQSKFHLELNSMYPDEEIASFFQLLVQDRLQLTRVEVALQPGLKVNSRDMSFFSNALTELQQEKPIQYILGKTEFYGLPFKVTSDVLIPRPETEELVDRILTELKEKRQRKKDWSQLTLLDIGTGSGCIAISLAKHLPNASIYALDVSEKALDIANQNAKLNKVSINFIQQDILDSDAITNLSKHLSGEQKFDVIISNPPYVRELEKHEISKNVLEYEPHTALFVKDENPLLFYDKIADVAKEQLSKDGILFFEINQYLGEDTRNLLKEKGFENIELTKDLSGNERMIKANISAQ